MDEIKVHVVSYPDRKNLSMRYRCPITGKQVQRSTGTSNKKQAERAAAVWEDELRAGRYQPASRKTWQEFRDKYESEVAAGLAVRTAEKVCTVLDAVERILSPRRVRDISADSLSLFASELRKGRSEATVAGYMAHLKAALTKAVDWELIAKRPKMPSVNRAEVSKAKGRAITESELQKLISATPKVVGELAATEWQEFIAGLFWSGLRLTEAIKLHWDIHETPDETCMAVDINGRRPMFVIPAAAHKAKRNVVLPMAPEFADMLERIPECDRHGHVFNLPRPTKPGYMTSRYQVGKTISEIGKRAVVITDRRAEKFATAHDLRRSFGDRWALRVMPAVLMEMMRHKAIQTTMTYYVGRDAETTADIIWQAYESDQ